MISKKAALSLFILGQIGLNASPINECFSKTCSPYIDQVTQSFKKGTALKSESETKSTVYHGACESYREGTIKKSMGLLLLDNIGGSLHFATNSVNYLPEMESGWNPYRYTTIEAMQKSSGGFHLEPEQELFNAKNYSFNKLRVEQPGSFHHIYVSDLDNDQLAVVGKKGSESYHCLMTKNSERKETPSEEGIPVSFGEDFCDFAYRCAPRAIDTMKAYHELNSVDLEKFVGKALTGSCQLNSGRGGDSFGQMAHLLIRLDKFPEGIGMRQKLTQGPKENPFATMTSKEKQSALNKVTSFLPILKLNSFAIALSPTMKAWMRSEDNRLIILGNWMGKQLTCELD